MMKKNNNRLIKGISILLMIALIVPPVGAFATNTTSEKAKINKRMTTFNGNT